MSRATGLLRALQRLPGATFGDAASALKATGCSNVFSEATKDVLSGTQSQQGYNFSPKLPGMPSFSFASQLHTSTKDDNTSTPVTSSQAPLPAMPKTVQALSALPPRPSTGLAARRQMGSAAEGHYHDLNEVHPFHVVPDSPWPFLTGQGCLLTFLGMAGWFHCVPGTTPVMFGGFASLLATALGWWRDCFIEGEMGMHTELQKRNLMSGIWLFIASEAALFFGLLWSCVHLGMSPSVWLHMQWPPVGVEAIGWEGRALVMSAVLAASYYSANVAVVAKDPKVVKAALATTIGLGVLFLADQYLEYSTAPFTITDSPYGTTFFVTTGFHGFHVLVGSVWLAAALASYMRSNKNGTALKGAVLYWHFVDIVWIAVYGIIYAAQL